MDDLNKKLRDEFEAWAKAENFDMANYTGRCYESLLTATAWETWQAARTPPVPQAAPSDYRIVPETPTDEMVRAVLDYANDAGEMPEPHVVWREMLAAAPAAPVIAQAASGEMKKKLEGIRAFISEGINYHRSHDSPPEPASKWDYEALHVIGEMNDIIEALAAALSAQAAPGEPVGEVAPCEDYGKTIRWASGFSPATGTKLYTAPVAAQQAGASDASYKLPSDVQERIDAALAAQKDEAGQ